jgi:sec-independent protein translocase protein TatB
MFSVPHLVIIFIVVLVVFGPHKLPELARSLGKMMAEFRKASTDFKMAFEEEMRTIERQAREVEIKKAQAAAAASSSEQQPATFGTTAGANPPRVSPETTTQPEPAISPVSEAVARDSNPAELSSADSYQAPVPEGTSSVRADSTTADPGDSGELPAHDHRQPA